MASRSLEGLGDHMLQESHIYCKLYIKAERLCIGEISIHVYTHTHGATITQIFLEYLIFFKWFHFESMIDIMQSSDNKIYIPFQCSEHLPPDLRQELRPNRERYDLGLSPAVALCLVLAA